MSFALTWGWDIARGQNYPLGPLGSFGLQQVGTAPPPNSLIINVGNGNPFLVEEMPGSPVVERGIQCTARHTFQMPYAIAVNYAAQIQMGTVIQDAAGNIWRVVTCETVTMEGDYGILTTVSESISFDSPPDEFQIIPSDMGIDIIKHPRYFPNLYPTADELGTDVGLVKESLIRAIQTYRDSPFFPTASNVTSFINGFVQDKLCANLKTNKTLIAYPNTNFNPNFDYVQDTAIQSLNSGIVPPPMATANGQKNDPNIPVAIDANTYGSPSILLAMAATQEIITKLWRMEDTPYIPVVEMKWTSHFFLPPLMTLGSYIEDPTLVVPNYFLQPDRPINELPPRSGMTYPVAGLDNVYEQMAQIMPQNYSNTGFPSGIFQMSSLRKADELNVERGLFSLTRTWVCGVIGQFDPQIYTKYTNRPSVPSDYTVFS